MKLRFLSSCLIATTLIAHSALALENSNTNTAPKTEGATANIKNESAQTTLNNTTPTTKDPVETTTNSTKNPGATSDQLKNSPKSIRAELQLKQTAGKLNANILVKQADNTAGKIQVKWDAPKQSACQNSQLALPYSNKQFHTRAYRTVEACNGEWTVSVLDENQDVISTQHFNVKATAPTSTSTAETEKDVNVKNSEKPTSKPATAEASDAVKTVAKKIADVAPSEKAEPQTAATNQVKVTTSTEEKI